MVGPAANTEAAELIEFAVSLPLLVVFMVGIFDFSSAFVLKQNIAHVAAEAARITANQPMSDVANPRLMSRLHLCGSRCRRPGR